MTLSTALYRLQFGIVFFVLLYFMAACTPTPAPEPRIEYRERVVEVAVECAPDLGPGIDVEQTRLSIFMASDPFVRAQRLTMAVLAAWQRLGRVEAALEGCRPKESP